MDPLGNALSLFRRRKYDKCIDVCSELLDKNPHDQAAWTLKTQALNEQVYVDDVENDEEGIAETVMDDNAITGGGDARPGTSLRATGVAPGGGDGLAQSVRPSTQAGRPLSGFVRPGTQSGRPGTMEQALRAPRTASTARPVTSASGRFVRLGTASMLSNTTDGGPFINIARLNLSRYAARPCLAKSLFEYVLCHENDVRSALELAVLASEASQQRDWWWKVQIGKCYFRLGLLRDAETQFRAALELHSHVDIYLHLGRICTRLDQPIAALELFEAGLERFPNDVSLLVAIARIHEALGDSEKSVSWYKKVVTVDSMNVESIACIAANYFYTDQPEVALKFYRRLLQLGVHTAEVFTNLGLCCFYAQQYDICMACFERALSLADKDSVADVWYNMGHVAMGVGDLNLAYQNFKLALSHNNDHAEAYNNMGVLELRRGKPEMSRAFFQAAGTLAPHMFQPQYNYAILAERVGDLQTSYQGVSRSLNAFPNHAESKDLLKSLKKHFSLV